MLFLEHQPCIRALKYAQGFKNKFGDEIEVFFAYLSRTLTEFYGYGDELFKEFIKLDRKDTGRDIKDTVRDYDIDLIHSHNAPDFLTESAIKSAGNVPIALAGSTVGQQQTAQAGLAGIGGELLRGQFPDVFPEATTGGEDIVERRKKRLPGEELGLITGSQGI